jgi:MFS family permease
VVGFSVFVAADDLTVVSTMLRPIIGDLGLVLPDGLDDAAWVVNAYLIAFVAAMPLAGRISDVIGRRRTFVGAYIFFLAGTILIPLSVTFEEPFGWFVTGRVLSAIGGGAMVPVALAVVGDAYPDGRRARALGTLGAIETMGWVWGPLYGAMLVRFLSWQWQFWLNVPLGIVGLAAAGGCSAATTVPRSGRRIDWLGASLLTVALVSVNVALLGSAEIQSVTGLDELTGGGARSALAVRVAWRSSPVQHSSWQQRRSPHPLLDRGLFRTAGRNLAMALVVNFVVGAGLVIAMVDVPLFVNSVEIDLERSAVIAGWVLSALTAAMAITSYVGGRLTERTWYRPPVLAGVALSTAAFAWMGATWDADAPYGLFAVQLGDARRRLRASPWRRRPARWSTPPRHQRGAAAVFGDGGPTARAQRRAVGADRVGPRPLRRTCGRRSSCPVHRPGFDEALRTPRQTSPRRRSPRPSPQPPWWSASACSPRSPCGAQPRRQTPPWTTSTTRTSTRSERPVDTTTTVPTDAFGAVPQRTANTSRSTPEVLARFGCAPTAART